MADAWTGLFALGGAGLGFLGATLTTARQLAHQREMERTTTKRETLRAFSSSAMDWADAARDYLLARVAGAEDLVAAWQRQENAWRRMYDAYALLLLVGSNALIGKIRTDFIPARDALVIMGSPGAALEQSAISEAAQRMSDVLGALLNDFRRELGEPEVDMMRGAVAIEYDDPETPTGDPETPTNDESS